MFSSLRKFVKIRAESQIQSSLFNLLPARNIRGEAKVNWIRPAKVPSYLPIKTGDKSNFENPDPESIRKFYDTHEKLKNCSNENLLKVFSMRNQSFRVNYRTYRQNLIDQVKAHKYDTNSEEVKIARLTADIRYNQYLWSLKPSYHRRTCIINELIHKRRRKLINMRETDYRKFEWLLEKLDLVFKPEPILCEKVCRKKSVRLLAELKTKKLKEKKLAEFKMKLDGMKVPFLEKKLQKMLWIKEQETGLQLTPSVSESDIEDCRKKIEQVKLQIKERLKHNYERKVHPYTLEVYEPKKSSVS